MGKFSYLIRRLLEMILVILVVAVLNFVFMHLAPGDVAEIMGGGESSQEYIDTIRHEYGLNLPLHVQLGKYMLKFFKGDLGHSFVRKQPVIEIIIDRLPATLILMLPSLIIATLVGAFVGAFAARKLGSKTDKIISGLSVGAYSIPIFWLGLMMIYLFSVHWNWFPSSGMTSFDPEKRGFLDTLHHLLLPTIGLSIWYIAQNIKVARASVAEVIREDYITTFRAAGFKDRTVFFKHALRNALLPIVSMSGLQFGYLLAGAVLTETVFSWPGMGQLVLQALFARDYPLIMGAYILMSTLVCVFTLLVDLLYVLIDPRIELQ